MDTRPRRGRPAKPPGERKERVWASVPQDQYDDLCRRATKARMSLSEYVGALLRAVAAGGFRL